MKLWKLYDRPWHLFSPVVSVEAHPIAAQVFQGWRLWSENNYVHMCGTKTQSTTMLGRAEQNRQNPNLWSKGILLLFIKWLFLLGLSGRTGTQSNAPLEPLWEAGTHVGQVTRPSQDTHHTHTPTHTKGMEIAALHQGAPSTHQLINME